MSPRSTGLACALAAVSIFSVQDAISKHLAGSYPPVFVIMIRYWVFAGFVLILAARSPVGLKRAASAKRPLLQIGRGVLLVAQVVVMIASFTVVGLAQTQAVFAAGPLVVACLSVPLLGETVGWRRWAMILVGFGGILLVVDPSQAEFDLKTFLPLLAVVMSGFYAILTRLGSRSDGPDTAFFYTGIAGAVAISLIGPFYWTSLAPHDWLWMAIFCITGMSGHYLLIRAFNLVDAVAVQPVTYVQTVLSFFIGAFVFGEMLTSNMLAGSAIVILAGLFSLWLETRRKSPSAS